MSVNTVTIVGGKIKRLICHRRIFQFPVTDPLLSVGSVSAFKKKRISELYYKMTTNRSVLKETDQCTNIKIYRIKECIKHTLNVLVLKE